MSILKDYINYAKRYINPRISEEAGQAFVEAYVMMRKVGSGRGQVSAYPRQLESLIRLSEAHARMRFCDKVELADVEEAKRYASESVRLLNSFVLCKQVIGFLLQELLSD